MQICQFLQPTGKNSATDCAVTGQKSITRPVKSTHAGESMKKLEEYRRFVTERKGQEMLFQCYSRKKARTFRGRIENAYPSMFTVLAETEDGPLRLSFTYADLLTQAVVIEKM